MRYNKIEANRYRQKNGLLIRYYMNPIFYNRSRVHKGRAIFTNFTTQ